LNLIRSKFGVLSKRQWQIAFMISGTITMMMITTGCTAAWIGEAQSIITTVTTIIGSIASILSLFGAAISPSVMADITTAATDIDNELATIGPLITQYETTPSPGTVSNIENVLTLVQGKIATLLSNIGITNPAVQTKIAAVLTLALNTVKELAALLPSTTTTATEHVSVTGTITKLKDYFDKAPVKKLKSDYNTILDTPTGDAEADAVFAKAKRL